MITLRSLKFGFVQLALSVFTLALVASIGTDAIANDFVSMGRRIGEIGKAVTARQEEAKRLNAEAKKIRAEHDRLVSSVNRIDPMTGEVDLSTVIEPKERAAFYAKLSKMREESSALDTASRKLGTEISLLVAEERSLLLPILKAQDEAREAADAARAAEARRQRELAEQERKKNEALQIAVDTMAVTHAFSELQAILGDNDRTLDALERKYDRGLIGAYMKDKMKTMLNDGVLCKAAANCSKSADSKSLIQETDLDAVFPFSRGQGSSKTRSDLRGTSR